MESPKINWDRAESASSVREVAEGWHRALIDDAFIGGTDEKPVLAIRYRLIGGQDDGRIVRDWMYFSPKALPRIKLLFDVVGRRLEGEQAIDPEDLLDDRLEIEVHHDEYQGRIRARITFAGFRPYPSSKRQYKPDGGPMPVSHVLKHAKHAAEDKTDGLPF